MAATGSSMEAREFELTVAMEDGQYRFGIGDREGFRRAMGQHSFALLRLTATDDQAGLARLKSDLAVPFERRAATVSAEFTSQLSQLGCKAHYKKQSWKERTQMRLPKSAGRQLAESLARGEADDERVQFVRLFLGLKELAHVCLSALLEDVGGVEAVQTAAKGFDASVLNVYHYFGCDQVDFDCRVHADPGLLSILTRSTRPGLEIANPTDGHDWYSVEPFMSGTGDHLLVIASETLQRVSHSKLPACIHRVTREPSVERTNLVFELRPTKAIWRWP